VHAIRLIGESLEVSLDIGVLDPPHLRHDLRYLCQSGAQGGR
jgi:hypothetical protein